MDLVDDCVDALDPNTRFGVFCSRWVSTSFSKVVDVVCTHVLMEFDTIVQVGSKPSLRHEGHHNGQTSRTRGFQYLD